MNALELAQDIVRMHAKMNQQEVQLELLKRMTSDMQAWVFESFGMHAKHRKPLLEAMDKMNSVANNLPIKDWNVEKLGVPA